MVCFTLLPMTDQILPERRVAEESRFAQLGARGSVRCPHLSSVRRSMIAMKLFIAKALSLAAVNFAARLVPPLAAAQSSTIPAGVPLRVPD